MKKDNNTIFENILLIEKGIKNIDTKFDYSENREDKFNEDMSNRNNNYMKKYIQNYKNQEDKSVNESKKSLDDRFRNHHINH